MRLHLKAFFNPNLQMNTESLKSALNLASPNACVLHLGIDPTFVASMASDSDITKYKHVLVDVNIHNCNSAKKLSNNFVVIHLLEPSQWSNLLQSLQFDIVVIRQETWEYRINTIKQLKDLAKIVIIPDCDYYPKHNHFGKVVTPEKSPSFTPAVFNFNDIFKYFQIIYPKTPWPLPTGPPVLIASNTINIHIPDKQKDAITIVEIYE